MRGKLRLPITTHRFSKFRDLKYSIYLNHGKHRYQLSVRSCALYNSWSIGSARERNDHRASKRAKSYLAILTRRKPTLLLRLSGASLLRFAERKFCALLFQLPPRMTRLEPTFGHYANFKDFSKIFLLTASEFTWETWATTLLTD